MSFIKPRYHYDMSMEECLFNFELTDSPHAKNLYGYQGRSGVAVGVALGIHHTEVQKKNIDFNSELDPYVLNRLATIRQASQDLCEEKGVPFHGMIPLDHGKGGVVVQIDEDFVIRMQNGRLPERPESKYILQAIGYKYLEEQNVTIEVLPKVEVASMTQADAQKVAIDALQDNIKFWDVTSKNVGRTKDGQILIIDPDSFQVNKPPAYKA